MRQRGAGSPADVVRWDACAVPLRDSCVDAVVADLPFGKRVGSRAENKQLYPALMREVWAGCCLTNTACKTMVNGRVENNQWAYKQVSCKSLAT
jgi:23S rRNA G2445 N2-methylase RlmL